MRLLKLPAVSATVISLAVISGMAQAFSFDFDDDDHPPTWVETYGQPAPRYYYYPQMDSFDRSRMIDHRQNRMQRRATTMNQLSDLLSGRYGFDREKAISLARGIEQTAGYALTRNFHPGAVIDSYSRTTRALWGNEEMFKQNAMNLQAAAKALAEELAKEPTQEEGAVYMRAQRKPGENLADSTVPVSPKVWEKYSEVSNSCYSCHRSFRSPFD
jgi:cytochrome c556